MKMELIFQLLQLTHKISIFVPSRKYLRVFVSIPATFSSGEITPPPLSMVMRSRNSWKQHTVPGGSQSEQVVTFFSQNEERLGSRQTSAAASNLPYFIA